MTKPRKAPYDPNDLGHRARRNLREKITASRDGLIINATTRASYDGADLAPYADRAGALTAYALPSRMGARLIHPDGRVTDAHATKPQES